MKKLSEEKLLQERERLSAMRKHEEALLRQGYGYVIGVDEAGRGPLCGPVAAAACILPPDCEILFLNDSKKLSEKKRELLFDERYRLSRRRSESSFIRRNIPEADPSIIVLVDGNKVIPGLSLPEESIIKGDASSLSIAAASILAKVTRDRMMYEYDRLYPGYGFGKNKGYGTKEHMEAIRRLGKTPIHRVSFLKNILPEEEA